MAWFASNTWVWDIVQTFSAIVTAVIAFLVFLIAQRIRAMEWYAKTGANWQDFNRLILNGDYAERWSEIISGNVPWAQIDQRDRMYIYSLLNVLLFEFQAQSHGLLHRKYADKSISDNILYFRAIWPDLHDHLTRDGWPEDFLRVAHRRFAQEASDPSQRSPGGSDRGAPGP